MRPSGTINLQCAILASGNHCQNQTIACPIVHSVWKSHKEMDILGSQLLCAAYCSEQSVNVHSPSTMDSICSKQSRSNFVPITTCCIYDENKGKTKQASFLSFWCSLVVNQIETIADLQQQLQSSAFSHLTIVWWLLKSESSSWPNNRFDLFFLSVL